MITATASEILKQAKFLSQAKNSDFVEFDDAITLLNNEYRDLYGELIDHSEEYTDSFIWNGEKMTLPDDCYAVQYVGSITGPDEKESNPITRAPLHQWVNNCYSIENNQIFVMNGQGSYICRYSKMPATLTLPNTINKLDGFSEAIDSYTLQGMSDSYAFFIDEGESIYYEYDLKTGELNQVDESTFEEDVIVAESTYLGKDFSFDTTNQTVTWNGEDVSDNFIAYDDVTGEQLKFTNILSSSPYLAIQYDNKEIYIMNGFAKTKWNILASEGIDTRGNIIALNTNDKTGDGLLVYFDDRQRRGYYYCSFVPDTVLSYPDNCFFQLLEARLASVISSLLGIENVQLNEVLLPRYEELFYKNLSKAQSGPIRKKNVTVRY